MLPQEYLFEIRKRILVKIYRSKKCEFPVETIKKRLCAQMQHIGWIPSLLFMVELEKISMTNPSSLFGQAI